MINRREALLGLGAAALGSMTSPVPAFAGLVIPPGADSSADDRLRKELALMATRANSEEGVPVLLACINQVPNKTTHMVPKAALSSWNAVVVADFRETAAAWQRVKPDATEGDVGSLIQVLALRDFAAGGKEKQ